MVFRVRGRLGWILGVLPLLCLGCRFDDAPLAGRHCAAPSDCPSPLSCCEGYCLPTQGCPSTDLLRLPDLPSPDLAQDSDFDGVPDDKDCAPSDPRYRQSLLSVTSFSDPAPFSPVENASDWQVTQGVYVQKQRDGLRRSVATVASGSLKNALAVAGLRMLDQGDDGLVSPTQNLQVAGVILRGANLTTGNGDGYYCAVDMASDRVQMGRTVGADLSKGILTLFSDSSVDGGAASAPGKALGSPVIKNLPYFVRLDVHGTTLVCQVVLPNQSSLVEMKGVDPTLSQGSMALFTAGASVQIETVTLCVP